MTTRYLPGFFLFIACAIAAPAGAFLVDEESQRQDYLAALEAVRAGRIEQFRKLRTSLDGYVLKGYLDYEYLKTRIDAVPRAELQRFLAENTDAPISEYLRVKWLRQLAAHGDWGIFLQEAKDIDDEPELLCMRFNRELKQSEAQATLMARIGELWLTERRLPSACQPVFDAWRRAGHMSRDQVWARIELAMQSGRLSLAASLARYLEPAERIWVERWRTMHRDPVRGLSRINFPVDTPVARMIVRHGVVRLAYRDPESAMLHWKRLKQEHQFFGEDENYVLRYLGILAAQDHLPVALDWLSTVSADPKDETLMLWRVKAALRATEWQTAMRFIAALPEDQQNDARWQYWKARALDAAGQARDAERLYASLARDRSYYGFLSADRLGIDYSMQHVAVQVTPEEVSTLLARPGIQMARELFALAQIPEARRQWHWSTRELNNRELQVAAVLAREWGWYDRAILTVSRSDHLDDLDLRFPVLYRDEIEANAAELGIDVGWIYGVVRQESAFVVDARSRAGALGLMQLMPATGRQTGRRIKLRVRGTSTLLDVENNLKLGASYLKEVLERYGGNQVLATASYNAGPHRVSDWLPNEEPLDAPVWVETIPFNETREYVKNVFAFAAVYDHRLGLKPTRLISRMPLIAPPKTD